MSREDETIFDSLRRICAEAGIPVIQAERVVKVLAMERQGEVVRIHVSEIKDRRREVRDQSILAARGQKAEEVARLHRVSRAWVYVVWNRERNSNKV